MHVATWNLSHAVKRDKGRRDGAWQYLAGLGLDIAIVQEAGLPICEAKSAIIGPNIEQPDWGTAVVSYGPDIRPLDQPLRPSWNHKVEFRIPDAARPGTLAVAVVETLDRPIVAVSLYGRLRYADQSVLRAASDLLPLFDTPLGRRVILAGDLNIHTHSDVLAERRRAVSILELLASLGLRDLVRSAKSRGLLTQGVQAHLERCPCGREGCSHVRTHRHPQHALGRMANNDYLFATDELAGRLESLVIMNGDDDEAWRHSDHSPMIARFRP